VSGADGSFTLKGLPPGTYTIEAWHEKYGAQTATVTVAGQRDQDGRTSVRGASELTRRAMHWWLRSGFRRSRGKWRPVLAITIITDAFVLVEVGLIWFVLSTAAPRSESPFTRTATTRGGDLDHDPGRDHGGAGADSNHYG